MPNWCSTTLDVEGTEAEVLRFLNGIKKDDDGRVSILRSYYPCPQELVDTVSGWSSDESEQAEREKQYEANTSTYGYKDWYDWSVANWGTKWSECDMELTGQGMNSDGYYATFMYMTAWSPATAGFCHISKMFPTLTFVFEHDEEGGFYAGIEVITNGEVVFEQMYEPSSYDEDSDSENVFYSDNYNEWKIQQMDTIYDAYVKWKREHSPSQASA